MVAGAIAGNISAEATTPTGNSFAEAMRGLPTAAHHARISSRRLDGENGVALIRHLPVCYLG